MWAAAGGPRCSRPLRQCGLHAGTGSWFDDPMQNCVASSIQRAAGRWVACAAALLVVACQQASPPPPATKPPTASAPAAKAAPAPVVVPALALPSLDFPPGPLYYCEAAGSRTNIDYEPRVEKLCRRHPEMGPCQYERDACRAKGGRVVTARGEEVTLAVEAEYDRSVRRVRFQADGAPAKR